MSDDVRSPQAVGAPPARVVVADAAPALLARLRVKHAGLMFHQSSGCCNGSV
jgi:uncharacterized protein (DUF779 family)